MSKIFFYLVVALAYITIMKFFSHGEYNVEYIKDNHELSRRFNSAPVSVILVNAQSIGLVVKTYFHKYKAVYPNQRPRFLIVRVSSQYFEKQKDYIGLSVLRRKNNHLPFSFVPLPPGALFVGDPSYGRWQGSRKNRVWYFNRFQLRLEQQLGIYGYQHTFQFFDEAKRAETQGIPFFGVYREFGTKGDYTKKAYPKYYQSKNSVRAGLKDLFQHYFSENFRF